MEEIERLLKEHPFFEGAAEKDLELISGCGRSVDFKVGSYIARENDPADFFYIVTQGKVGIETFIPQKRPLLLQTLSKGEILGWSWLFPPYQWTFDVRAIDDVKAVALDGRCLRVKCDEDPRMGLDLMKRFARIMTQRLRATRLQLIDVYGDEL